jgi:hypothetical protein
MASQSSTYNAHRHPGTEPRLGGGGGSSTAHEDPMLWAPRLERILGRQLGLYRQLAELSNRQHDLVERDQTDGLMAVLADRQRLIDQIADINGEVEPFAAHWVTLAAKLNDTQRASIGVQLGELDELVASISARDEHDRSVLESRRAEASSALDGLSKRKAAMGAYGGGATSTGCGPRPDARFQDRKG